MSYLPKIGTMFRLSNAFWADRLNVCGFNARRTGDARAAPAFHALQRHALRDQTS